MARRRAPDMAAFVAHLRRIAEDRLEARVAYHRVLEAAEPEILPVRDLVSEPVALGLERLGIRSFYSHQAEAIQAVRQGRDLVLATGTGSGKTVAFFLPIAEALARDPAARALAIYPLRALERDQRRVLETLGQALGLGEGSVAVLDGDTPPEERRRLRRRLPRVLVTTPDMLHYGILARWDQWGELLAKLRFVVVDELHTYRGLFGSQVACVLRRLRRLCAAKGSRPQFLAASATVGNPGELARLVLGSEDSVVVDRSGAGSSRRHHLVLEPLSSGYGTAYRLLVASLKEGLRTILFTKSRRATEVLFAWLRSGQPRLAERVSSYRSGYRPEERRQIEAGLATGELLGVISTSALELGIDIGGLQVCILAGYPGTISSLFQRSGRVGRRGEESLTVLVTFPDALDGYFLNHPEELFTRRPEDVALDPDNPYVLSAHLPPAAAELPLREGEGWPLDSPGGRRALERCLAEGTLVEAAGGGVYHPARARPHQDCDLRATGENWILVEDETGEVLGDMSAARVWREAHPEAVYLHRAESYVVRSLDPEHRLVRLRGQKVGYYTEVRTEKETEILEEEAGRALGGFSVHLGRLQVTERVVGYVKRRIATKALLGFFPLELPDQVIETEGFWIQVSREVAENLAAEGFDLMGSLHALEHALIGLFPLLVSCDRFDVGGISLERHPGLGLPAVFVYDGYHGGAGFARKGFARFAELVAAVARQVSACPCENGCPSCIHSPKCGNGNQPLDKAGAVWLAYRLAEAAGAAGSAPGSGESEPEGSPQGWDGHSEPDGSRLVQAGGGVAAGGAAQVRGTGRVAGTARIAGTAEVQGTAQASDAAHGPAAPGVEPEPSPARPMPSASSPSRSQHSEETSGTEGFSSPSHQPLESEPESAVGSAVESALEPPRDAAPDPSADSGPDSVQRLGPGDVPGISSSLEPESALGSRPAGAREQAGDVAARLAPVASGERGADPGQGARASSPNPLRSPASLFAPLWPEDLRVVVFDLETRRSAEEVGGWDRARDMGLAVGVVYDSLTGEYVTYLERDAGRLVAHLAGADLVCGFNVLRFDYQVLSAYTDQDLRQLPTLDILAWFKAALGFRVSLDNLARATLGVSKSADGLTSLEWVRQGRLDLVAAYCRDDVAITRALLEFGLRYRYLLYHNKEGRLGRIPVDWDLAGLARPAEGP